MLSYFPEIDADVTDPRSRSMLVRHVASMASGHDHETVDEAFGADPAEPVRGFLLQPPQRDPGTLFTYNQPCTYTLGAIVQRVTGQTLVGTCGPGCSTPWASARRCGPATAPDATSASPDCTSPTTR